jgi:hypothetical protein
VCKETATQGLISAIRHRFSKALCIVALYSEDTRALTFQNVWQAAGSEHGVCCGVEGGAFTRDPHYKAALRGKSSPGSGMPKIEGLFWL